MKNEIQVRHSNHPELWDEKNQMVRLAPNGKSIKSTKQQALRILVPMFNMFPRIEINEVAMQNYVRLLQDIEPAKLQDAVDAALMECEFLPTVAKIRECHERKPAKSKLSQAKIAEPEEVTGHAKIGEFNADR